jgi:hypothetical protein
MQGLQDINLRICIHTRDEKHTEWPDLQQRSQHIDQSCTATKAVPKPQLPKTPVNDSRPLTQKHHSRTCTLKPTRPSHNHRQNPAFSPHKPTTHFTLPPTQHLPSKLSAPPRPSIILSHPVHYSKLRPTHIHPSKRIPFRGCHSRTHHRARPGKRPREGNEKRKRRNMK